MLLYNGTKLVCCFPHQLCMLEWGMLSCFARAVVLLCHGRELLGLLRPVMLVCVCVQGYKQMRINRGPKSLTCFVEFADVAAAMAVHAAQQVLPRLLACVAVVAATAPRRTSHSCTESA
jgi:hypothetical protein